MKTFLISCIGLLLLGTVAKCELQIDYETIFLENIEFEDNDVEGIGPFDPAPIFQKILRKIFSFIDPIVVPFIPVLSFNRSDSLDIAISMTDVNLTGISNIEVPKVNLPIIGRKFRIDILFPQLRMTAIQYSAGGHILNMPFAGESFLYISLEKVSLTLLLGFDTFFLNKTLDYEFCIASGTTEVPDFTIGKPIFHFNNLNPGTDQGSMINSFFAASIQDIADSFARWLPGSFIDELFVNEFNSIFCNYNNTEAIF